MAKLIGTDPNQVPTNADLGDMAYQNGRNMAKIKAQQIEVESGGAQSNLYLRTNDATHYDWRFTNEGNVNRLRLSGAKTGLSSVFPLYVNGDAGGAITMPEQPAFLVRKATAQNNLPINQTTTITYQTEIFDQGGNFGSNTFTAPVTGKYQFNVNIRVSTVDISAGYYHVYLYTSNDAHPITLQSPSFTSDPVYWSYNSSILVDMDAGDSAYVAIYQNNGAAQTDIQAASDNNFSGFLVS